MKFIAVVVFSIAALFGEIVPGRYIVELSGDPAAVALARRGTRFAARESDFAARRGSVRQRQASVRDAVTKLGGKVIGSMDTIYNGLVVEIPDARAAQLESIPGVLKLHPVHRERLALDHALPVHKVPDAWAKLPQGQNSAGAGIKIAFIDTGIDVSNPAYSQSLPPVPGFPKVLVSTDTKFTNSKVIVAKNYTSTYGDLVPPGGDPDADDYDGHGTGTSMCAAGGPATVPWSGVTLTGVAPQAYLGSYKVFDANGNNTEDAIVQAIDDAVADGMDVINMSLGAPVFEFSGVDPSEPGIAAIEAATQAGVLVTVSAGNDGPDAGSIEDYASAPDAITVGAMSNDRSLNYTATFGSAAPVLAEPGSEPNPGLNIAGPALDVTQVDPTGLVCSPLPAGSATGMVVLIMRGTCTFESKLDNAAAGGAIGALVYDNNTTDQFLILMEVGAATLPAMFVSNADGMNLKSQIDSNPGATLSLNLSAPLVFPTPTDLVFFSSRGPSIGSALKPDLLAVGFEIVTAAEKSYPSGQSYDSSGFSYLPNSVLLGGTSLSAPLAAGGVAILKAARPGLSMQQYRSLLINSSSPATNGPGVAATVQQAGAGILNVGAALNGTVAAYPTSLNFGSGPGSISNTLNLTLSNTGTASDTFSIQVVPTGNSPAPALSASTVQLDPNASQMLTVTVNASGLAPGEYQGYLQVSSTKTSTIATIPYWFGVPGDPGDIVILQSDAEFGSDPPGVLSKQAIVFRIVDVAGLPYAGSQKPAITIASGGGALRSLYSIGDIPGTYAIDIRTGTTDMTINVSVGGVVQQVIIPIG